MRTSEKFLKLLGARRLAVVMNGRLFQTLTEADPALIEDFATPYAKYYESHYRDSSLTYSDETGNPRSISHLATSSRELLELKAHGMLKIARNYRGMIARGPELGNATLATWCLSSKAFPIEFRAHVEKIGARVRQEDLFLASSQSDLRTPSLPSLEVMASSPSGITVSGVKAISTAAPLADEIVILPNRFARQSEESKCFAACVPVGLAGLQIVCRTRPNGFSNLNRYWDEIDAMLVFDQAFIPWERLMYFGSRNGYVDFVKDIRGLLTLRMQNCSHAIAKMETLIALLKSAQEVLRIENLGDIGGAVVSDCELLKSAYSRAVEQPEVSPFGFYHPNRAIMASAHCFFSERYPLFINQLRNIFAPYLTCTIAPLESPNGSYAQVLGHRLGLSEENLSERILLIGYLTDLFLGAYGARSSMFEAFHTESAKSIHECLWKDECSSGTGLGKSFMSFMGD